MVEQPKIKKVGYAFKYVNKEFSAGLQDLNDEDLNDSKHDAAWLAARDANAKAHFASGLKMLGWLIDNLGANIPTKYTDVEVDAINRQIRTVLPETPQII